MLSDCLLGENMGIIDKKGKMTPVELMIKSAPSFILGTPEERDIKRAGLLRDNIRRD